MASLLLGESARRVLRLAAEHAGGRRVDTLDVLVAASRDQPESWLRALLRLELPEAALRMRSSTAAETQAPVVDFDGMQITKPLEEAAALAMHLARCYGFEGCPSGLLVIAVVLVRGSFAGDAVRSGGASVTSSAAVFADSFLDGELDGLHDAVIDFYRPRSIDPASSRVPTRAGPRSTNASTAPLTPRRAPPQRGVLGEVRAELQLRERRIAVFVAIAAVLLIGQSAALKVLLCLLLLTGVFSLRWLVLTTGTAILALVLKAGWIVFPAVIAAAVLARLLARSLLAPYGRRRMLKGERTALLLHPRLLVTELRAQRLQRLDFPADALPLLADLAERAPRGVRYSIHLQAAEAALQASDYQQVLDWCARVRTDITSNQLPPSLQHRAQLAILEGGALLGLGRTSEAMGAIQFAVQQSRPLGDGLLGADAQMALGEGLLRTGSPVQAGQCFAEAAKQYLACSRFLDLGRAIRERGRAYAHAGARAQAEQSFHEARDLIIDYVLLWRRKMFEEGLPARARAAMREYALTGLALARLTVDDDGDAEDFLDWVGTDMGASAMFEELDQPLEQAECLGLIAHRLERDGNLAKALTHRLTAVGALDERRYQLRSQTDRITWGQRYTEAVQAALACAVAAGDPAAAAQVMEAARLQGVPRSHHKATTGTSPAAQEAGRPNNGRAWTRVAAEQHSVALLLQGELPLRPPPVIRVRGDARLLGPHAGERPVALDLEQMAALAAGEGAWWWGQWSSATSIYWSVVPPSGEVASGRIDCRPGSPLAKLLERLAAALPIRLPHEADSAVAQRVVRGELLDPVAEPALAAALGAALVPELLREELCRRAQNGLERLSLAIAPAEVLARLPWSILGVPGTGDWLSGGNERTARLVELADLAIVPSAALLNLLSKRPPAPPGPVGLAVLNPTSDLPETHRRRVFLPRSAALLDDGTAGMPGTKANLRRALIELERSSTAVFGCHAKSATPRQPSTSALVLRADREDPGYLTAEELFAEDDGHRSYPLPRSVVVLGCESADVSGASRGEWLTLGPALLWAGADEAIVTLYPILDDSPAESELLSLLDHGVELWTALGRWQRECLAQWQQAGEEWYSPLHWGGHAVLGCQFDRPAPSPTLVGEVSDAFLPPLSGDVVSLLSFALKTARELHQSVVTTGNVVLEYLQLETEAYETHFLKEAFLTFGGVALVKGLRREREPEGTRADPRPSPALRNLVVNARRRAAEMGSPVTLPAHLLLEMLNGHYPDGRLILTATGARLRPSFRRTLLRESRRQPHNLPDLFNSTAGRDRFISHVLGEGDIDEVR